jgi:hypothetical protein
MKGDCGVSIIWMDKCEGALMCSLYLISRNNKVGFRPASMLYSDFRRAESGALLLLRQRHPFRLQKMFCAEVYL